MVRSALNKIKVLKKWTINFLAHYIQMVANTKDLSYTENNSLPNKNSESKEI